MRKPRKARGAVDRTLYGPHDFVGRPRTFPGPLAVMPLIHKLKNALQAAVRNDKTAENLLRFFDVTAIRFWPRHVSK